MYMQPFDYQPRTRIVFGPGRIDTLGELASELGARRAMVVSDPGVVAAGHTAKGVAAAKEFYDAVRRVSRGVAWEVNRSGSFS